MAKIAGSSPVSVVNFTFALLLLYFCSIFHMFFLYLTQIKHHTSDIFVIDNGSSGR
jgi:hypothetical protein